MFFQPNPRKIEKVCHVFSEFTIKGEMTVHNILTGAAGAHNTEAQK